MKDAPMHAPWKNARCRAQHPAPPQRRSGEPEARDAALLHALDRGDAEAFWTLWMTHAPRLFAVCMREMNRKREDAEDALQEAMLHAYATLPRFAGRITSPASWLNRITTNVCRDMHRRRTRNARLEERARTLVCGDVQMPECEMPAPAAEPCDAAELIARLPDRLRAVFVLRILQQASYSDIASRLGVTCATARKRVQQARTALRAWRDAGP